jgi:hypothetical protein
MRPLGLGLTALACIFSAVFLVSYSFRTSRVGQQTTLLSSGSGAHAKHSAHKEKGTKYSRELAELSKEADPNRRSALAVIDAMAKRADRGAGITKSTSGEKDNDELGRLAKAHGIGKKA